MKSFTLLTLFSMLSTSFQNNVSFKNSLEETGSHVISAFKKSSIEEYRTMLPTLAEFYQIMDSNDGIYGEHVNEAKKEFADRYEREIVPSVKTAFNGVLAEGNKRGINWENIQFVRIENEGAVQSGNPVELNIVFREGNEEYTLRIENAFIWQGQWRITQFIHLL